MRNIRLCLVLLLAVLLPVRGAMAAAMLCPPAGGGWQTELGTTAAPVDHHPLHAAKRAAAHEHASDRHATPDEHPPIAPDAQHTDEADPAQHDACDMCSASCSVTPLPGSVPAVPMPPAVPSVPHPPLDAPHPVFLSDGQDRPPRSA